MTGDGVTGVGVTGVSVTAPPGRVTRTTCPYCGVGCGLLAKSGGESAEIRGDPRHPSGAGRLCSKGSALGETLGLQGRLLRPRVDGHETGWNKALDLVAHRFAETISKHGPDSVAFYASGQLLTEDYYVANKLMKGFLGSANIDTNSRLCMSSAVVGHKRAFGADVVPGCYEDLELADVLVLVGSNTAWCHPVLWRRVEEARRTRPEMRVVVIDPRRTATAVEADLHLPIRSGTDVSLFAGLLAYLDQGGFRDAGFVERWVDGVDDALRAADSAAGSMERVAAACGLSQDDVRTFFDLFARTERVVTAFSQGVNQSSSGSDKVSAILNCHLLTGRIGKPGMGPLSLTGQPNAMGGREVGGMATMLAAHMDVESEAHRHLVQDFWNSPRMPTRRGLTAVNMFDAVADGRIKALWVLATNPAVSLPNADKVRSALARCEFLVVSDCIAGTDTTELAHVAFPAAAWGEKDGTTTNTERRISRQRAFLSLPGNARPDWWILTQVAARMGYAADFPYTSPHSIFDEHARLSAFHNGGKRSFDIGGLAGMTSEEYENLEPIQWPVPTRGHPGTARLFGNGGFLHERGRARLVATTPLAPAHALSAKYPFVLNTGRLRDQWHTMTRTGTSPRLAEHSPEPFVELHRSDASRAKILEGDLVRVTTAWGSALLRAKLGEEVTQGSLFVPIHWSAQNSSHGRVDPLVNPAVDRDSGQPEFKHTPAAIERVPIAWRGVLVTRERSFALDPGRLRDHAAATSALFSGEVAAPAWPPANCWWTRVQGDGFVRYELLGSDELADPFASGQSLVDSAQITPPLMEYRDKARGVYRAARVEHDRLHSYLALSRDEKLPSRTWLAEMLGASTIGDRDRTALLAGRPLTPSRDLGPLVCSCFGVRQATITEAIAREALTTAAAVGSCLRAGTNCGSCLPEIATLLAARSLAAPPPRA